MTLRWVGREHTLYATLQNAHYVGKLCGLLGDADGDKTNDYVTREGRETRDSNEFAGSWKVPDVSCEYE
ncbi:vitellogenin-like [Glandiceps talaboti]